VGINLGDGKASDYEIATKKGLVSEALNVVDRLLRPQGRRSYFFFFAAAFFFGAAFFLVAIVYSPNRNSRLRKIACVIHI